MYRKFAHMDYVSNNNEIPVRLNSLRKNPSGQMDWYIRRFNPFTTSDVVIANENGYFIKLPITKDEADKNMEKAEAIINGAVNTLKGFNVEIVLPPQNVRLPKNEKMTVADGAFVFPYFALEAAEKAVKKFNIQKTRKEIVVIVGGKSLTDSLIYNVAPGVEFLTVLDTINDPKIYDCLIDYIFKEYGLLVSVSKNIEDTIKNADIIFNMSAYKKKTPIDYYYKKGVILFDLLCPPDEKRKNNRQNKNMNMNIINTVQINVSGEKMPLPVFELAFYIKSGEYRDLCAKGFDFALSDVIQNQIKKLNVRVSSL